MQQELQHLSSLVKKMKKKGKEVFIGMVGDESEEMKNIGFKAKSIDLQ